MHLFYQAAHRILLAPYRNGIESGSGRKFSGFSTIRAWEVLACIQKAQGYPKPNLTPKQAPDSLDETLFGSYLGVGGCMAEGGSELYECLHP